MKEESTDMHRQHQHKRKRTILKGDPIREVVIKTVTAALIMRPRYIWIIFNEQRHELFVSGVVCLNGD